MQDSSFSHMFKKSAKINSLLAVLVLALAQARNIMVNPLDSYPPLDLHFISLPILVLTLPSLSTSQQMPLE